MAIVKSLALDNNVHALLHVIKFGNGIGGQSWAIKAIAQGKCKEVKEPLKFLIHLGEPKHNFKMTAVDEEAHKLIIDYKKKYHFRSNSEALRQMILANCPGAKHVFEIVSEVIAPPGKISWDHYKKGS